MTRLAIKKRQIIDNAINYHKDLIAEYLMKKSLDELLNNILPAEKAEDFKK